MKILLKRAYEAPAKSDGVRVLVDRLWPRGVSKENAQLKAWLKDLAPSNELRQWYHARPRQWPVFRKRYLLELANEQAIASLELLHNLADRKGALTLVFASRDVENNNAVVLKELLEGVRKPPASSGPLKSVASSSAKRAVRPRH